MDIGTQLSHLFILAIPIACIAWMVTHEEIFREPREYCVKCATDSKTLLKRKFFYVFTCEYCFSHYITIAFLIITKYRLLFDDWRGYLIGGFALVWIANVYMSIYNRLRVELKKTRTEIEIKEEEKKQLEEGK